MTKIPTSYVDLTNFDIKSIMLTKNIGSGIKLPLTKCVVIC